MPRQAAKKSRSSRPDKTAAVAAPARRSRVEPRRLIHDLNNSLTAIRIRLDLIDMDPPRGRSWKENGPAIAATLADAQTLARRLEELASPPSRR